MQLSKQVTSLMGKKVEYVRIKHDEGKGPELYNGNGVIVGIIVSATRRIQIMVKDVEDGQNKAYTLDLMCVNPTLEESEKYWNHNKKIRAIVDEHNQAQKDREQAKIKEVDDLNYKMFGDPLEV